MSKKTSAPAADAVVCDPADRTTRSLLGYGVLAGPFYTAVGLIEASTRKGFELSKHDLSLLSNGSRGWIHIATLVLTGAMVVVAAKGWRRALIAEQLALVSSVVPGGAARSWAPRLLAAYGVGMVAAGIFIADPAEGFPPGTADGPGEVSWHGALHLVSAGLGFLAAVAACFVMGRRFTAAGQANWARYSRITGVLFLLGFVLIAANIGTAGIVAFWIGLLVLWAWLATVSAQLYRWTGRRVTAD